MLPEPRLPSDSPEKQSSVEQELQDFSYMVSHDLAASFRHVSEFSRLLLNDLGENLTPRQRGYSDRIQTASGRCQAMMEQLLVFSRAQQKVLTPTTFDATLMMRMATLQLSEEIQSSKAEIAIGSLGEVYADRDLLQHALSSSARQCDQVPAP